MFSDPTLEKTECAVPRLEAQIRPLSAAELNAYMDSLTASFNHLNLGYIRRSHLFAIPDGWRPDGMIVTSQFSGPVRGFAALDIDKRMASRIARYMTPKRANLTEKDTRFALLMIGEEVVSGMQTRLVHMGMMAQISTPQVMSTDEWMKHYSDHIAVGIIPIYSSCGVCHLAFN